MKIIRAKSYAELSRAAADIIGGQIREKPGCVLGLATGSTPVGTYKALIDDYQNGRLDFSGVRTVNLDEYVGLGASSSQSYRRFMDDNLFSRVNISKANTHIPNGLNEDSCGECERYEKLIESLGGIDLQLLGVGHNGHVGFNEPDSVFPVKTHCVGLTQSTLEANKRFFSSIDEVPKRAYTMGIGTIMSARKILLLINGSDKAEITERFLGGEVDPRVPVSILKFHPDATVIIS